MRPSVEYLAATCWRFRHDLGSQRLHSAVIPVFDGHNDALTREDHADLACRPRRRRPRPAADARGRDAGRDLRRLHRDAGRRLGRGSAAGGSTAASPRRWPSRSRTRSPPPTRPPPPGRLLRLEREGAVTVARRIADLDAAFADESLPPVAVLHLEGAEAIDPGLEALELWHAAGLRSLGPVWSRPNAFATGVQFAFPSSPDIGPGPDRRRPGAGRPLRRARYPRRPQPPKRSRLLGRRRARAGAAGRQPLRRPRDQRSLAQPHRRPARRDRRLRRPGRDRLRRPLHPPRLRRRPRHPAGPDRRSTRATSPTGSASATSASAPTSTGPRSRPSSATSPACRSSSRPSARPASTRTS